MNNNGPNTTLRITQRENRTYGIVNFDDDNAYPQRIYSLTNSAPTARTCVDTYSRFIGGSGFADTTFYQTVVNSEGQTMDKILSLVKKDMARFRGFALHVNVNAEAKITDIFHVPFEHVRMAAESKKNETGFDFATYYDWGREKRSNLKAEHINWFHAFNLSAEAIAIQVESLGGWDKYKGQLLYVSLDENSYPLSSCDAVLESLNAEIQSDIRTTANLQNNFSAKTILVHKGKFADEESREEFQKSLNDFIGPEGSDLMVVDVDSNEEVPDLVPITSTADDKLFEYTDSKITNKIIRNFLIPKVLLSVTDGSGFFNQEQVRDATMYYNMVTVEERLLLEATFKKLGGGFQQSINPSGDYHPMTTIESKEIRGITLRILYLLVAFSVVSTAGIMTSYFSLKNDNQLLGTQIEILKIQYKIIDERLEKIESKKDNQYPKDHSVVNAVSQKPSTYNKLIASTDVAQIR